MYVCVWMHVYAGGWLCFSLYTYLKHAMGLQKKSSAFGNRSPTSGIQNQILSTQTPYVQPGSQPSSSRVSAVWVFFGFVDSPWMDWAGQGRIPELCWCWSINVNDLLIIICKILCCRSPHTHTGMDSLTRTLNSAIETHVQCPMSFCLIALCVRMYASLYNHVNAYVPVWLCANAPMYCWGKHFKCISVYIYMYIVMYVFGGYINI